METEPIAYTHIHGEIEKLVVRNWLTESWGLANLKSVGQASRLATQGRGDAVVLNLNFSAG